MNGVFARFVRLHANHQITTELGAERDIETMLMRGIRYINWIMAIVASNESNGMPILEDWGPPPCCLVGMEVLLADWSC